MPELCRFDGIRVFIYSGDHVPPHFHAWRADFRVKVDISTITVTKGRMPSSVERRLLALGGTASIGVDGGLGSGQGWAGA